MIFQTSEGVNWRQASVKNGNVWSGGRIPSIHHPINGVHPPFTWSFDPQPPFNRHLVSTNDPSSENQSSTTKKKNHIKQSSADFYSENGDFSQENLEKQNEPIATSRRPRVSHVREA